MSAAFARRRWSVEEFQCAIRLGLFREDERLELLDRAPQERQPAIAGYCRGAGLSSALHKPPSRPQ